MSTTTLPPRQAGPARSSAWSRRDTLIAYGVVLITASLLSLSTYQLLTELARVPARVYYQQYRETFSKPIIGASFTRQAVERIERIPPERRGEQEWRRLAELLMLLPLPDNAPETIQQRRDDINAAVKAALIRNPLHPLSWAFLAELQLPPLGECDQGMPKVRQSYRVAPIEPEVAFYRLELAARCLPDWGPDLTDAIRADIRTLMRSAPASRRDGLMGWTADQPAARALVEQLLANDPVALERFLQELNRRLVRLPIQ